MTTTVAPRPDPGTARQTDAQVARMVRKAARPAEPRPRVPYEHHVLFREAAYTDGQPYTDDDLDDED